MACNPRGPTPRQQQQPQSQHSWSSRAWPALHPPVLVRLPQPAAHPHQPSLPPSLRYRVFHRPSLQDDADALDWEEERFHTAQHETRSYGFSWLVPLGRLNTQEEDAEAGPSPFADASRPSRSDGRTATLPTSFKKQSAFSSSPRPSPGADVTLDDVPSPVDVAHAAPVAAAAPAQMEVDLDAQIEDRDSENNENDDEGDDEQDESDEEEADSPDEEESGDDVSVDDDAVALPPTETEGELEVTDEGEQSGS